MTDKVGRNDPCPCGSGKKYKLCCAAAEMLSNPSSAVQEKNRYRFPNLLEYLSEIRTHLWRQCLCHYQHGCHLVQLRTFN
ncbi:MAG: SEC-C metal-binding domain-containing protein [Betaproteobacteria bacterium]